MRHDNIDCQKRYYKQGDIAPVYPMPWRCEPFIGTVERVSKNSFGRVSLNARMYKGSKKFIANLLEKHKDMNALKWDDQIKELRK